MRYEKKFIVEENFSNKICNFLIENKFVREFPDRAVNSIYYDSICFKRFHQSEEGISDRGKLRLRFYDQTKDIYIEQKIKSAELGKKIIEPFNNFNSKELININVKSCENRNFKIAIPKEINFEIPSLFITYKREYFKNKKENIRITLDNKLLFGRLRNGSNIIKKPININSNFSVLEGKYSAGNESSPLLEMIISKYSLNLSRCSKYCYGIKTCY